MKGQGSEETVFTDEEKRALVSSWRLVVPIADTAADLFYRRLFELRPEYRRLFPEDLSAQKRKLIKMLAFVIKALDWVDDDWQREVEPNEDLMLVLLALGRRHSKLYGVPDESYAVVGEALLWTLDYALGDAFTLSVRNAWVRLYTLLAQAMRLGASASEHATELVSASEAELKGEIAFLAQQAAAGIDEARLGSAEETT